VPKFLVNKDGSVGARNGVSCGSIEHKMGITASSTCVMNFDGAAGYLVGEINKGLAGMFTMMNYERLSVGIQGLGCSEISYQGAVRYARDRIQSRAPTGAVNKAAAADPIIVHPDVRRMLMTQRAFIEAGRAFAVYTGMQLDVSKYGEGEAQQRAEALVALLTPVAKAFMTDKGLDCCVLGQQVFGGHGYIREWGMEQLVRDVRIAQIYEGTNGIQALDLMGRKVAANGGAYVKLFAEDIDAFLAASKDQPALAEFTAALARAKQTLLTATQWVVDASRNDGNAVGAASVEYLHLFGYTAYAFMWARMAAVAVQHAGDTFYANKLLTGRFFLSRLLPQIESLRESIMNGSESMMALAAEHF